MSAVYVSESMFVNGTMRSNSRVVARPLWIDEIVRDFPTLKIVALHSGYPWEDELIAMAIT